MSSPITHRRSQSTTTRITPTHSRTASATGASPKRQPLLERSRSQANVSPTRQLESKIYRQSPFPQLPSQLFPPRPAPRELPILPGPYRPHVHSISSETPNEAAPAIPWTRIPDTQLSSGRTGPTPADERPPQRSRKGKEPATEDDRDWSRDMAATDAIRGPAPTSLMRRLTPSDSLETFAIRRARQKDKAIPSNRLPRDQYGFVDLDTPSLMPRPLDVASRRPSVVTQSASRPRSLSSPDGSTDSFIEDLISGDAQIESPTIRHVPYAGASMRVYSGGPEYTTPLRLQRKRASSHLGRAPVDAIHPLIIRKPTTPASSSHTVKSSAMRRDSGSSPRNLPPPPPPPPPPPHTKQPVIAGGPPPGNWAEEIGDVVTELNPKRLKKQRSDFHVASSDSRPATRESSRSRPGSLYHFLNDSVTDWTQYYYRNESRVQIDTPPLVTQVQFSPEFNDYESRYASPSHRSKTQSLDTSASPGSAGFPETLFVRRLRPHSFYHKSTIPPARTQKFPSFSTPDPAADTSHARDQVFDNRRDSGVGAAPPITPPHRPTAPLPMIPHLSPDRSVRPGPTPWRAPSLDFSLVGSFSPLNRQVLLFCLGFLFPPVWWLAAVLPLPQRPQWARGDHCETTSHVPGRVRAAGARPNDLFTDHEVVHWQKARWWRSLNRGMSVLGVCILTVVITCVAISAN